MWIAPHLKKRALFIFCVMFPPLVLIDYLGYNSIVVSGVLGGIAGGLAVVLFPEQPADARRQGTDRTATGRTAKRSEDADAPKKS